MENLKIKSIGLLVAEQPLRAQIFDSLGIDYCCQGHQSLAAACLNRSLNTTEVQALLDQCDRTSISGSDHQTWLNLSLTDLAAHIQNTHHAYLKTELPRLVSLSVKVARVHGDKEPSLLQLATILQEFKIEIDQHTSKEDAILFPYICRLEKSATSITPPFGTIANPIHCMESEHEIAGKVLYKFRELTNQYAIPDKACNSWVALFRGLKSLDDDLRIHILKENTILFPRAIERENELESQKTN